MNFQADDRLVPGKRRDRSVRCGGHEDDYRESNIRPAGAGTEGLRRRRFQFEATFVSCYTSPARRDGSA